MGTNAEELFDGFDEDVPTDAELEAAAAADAEAGGADDQDQAGVAEGGVSAEQDSGGSAPAVEGDARAGEAADQAAREGGNSVPLAVLLEERNQSRAEINELRSRLEKMQSIGEELKAWREAQAKQQEQPKTPDYYEDPEGFVKAQVEQGEKAINELNQRVESMTQQQQMAATLQSVQQHLSQIEGEYVREHPDFDDAVSHVRDFYVGNMTSMGAEQAVAEQQADKMIFVGQITALQRGVNPAQFLYDMATRAGYRPPEQTGEQQNNGVMDDVRRLAESQQAGSMGSASGALDEMADMEEDEFDAAMKEMGWS